MRTTVFSTPLVTPLLRWISILVFALIGWKIRGRELGADSRCVLIGAPHTSNWDFPLMIMAVLILKLRVFWMGKHTLFPFPFAGLMKWLGGIPIDRSRPQNVVRETVRQYERRPRVDRAGAAGRHTQQGETMEVGFLFTSPAMPACRYCWAMWTPEKKKRGLRISISPAVTWSATWRKSANSTRTNAALIRPIHNLAEPGSARFHSGKTPKAPGGRPNWRITALPASWPWRRRWRRGSAPSRLPPGTWRVDRHFPLQAHRPTRPCRRRLPNARCPLPLLRPP